MKSALPEGVVEGLFGLRSAVRGFFFQSGEKQEHKPSMETADREYLSHIYENPNAQLEDWLERDLSHWT
jgi:hypothetical protein